MPHIKKQIVHGELKDFRNLTLLSFITGTATHKVHGLCDFGLLLPNMHGLIKLLMGDSDSKQLCFKLFAAINGYQFWEAYADYSRVKYDELNNYWSYDANVNSKAELELLVKLIIEELGGEL